MSDEVSSIRESDRRQLQRLVDASPRTRVVTVRGEAGIGKSTLLAGLADAAVKTGWQVLRATGSTSETVLSLAGLHQLLRPLLGSVDTLPAPQRAAVSAAFGLAEAARPTDPLLLYLGCLTLLSQHSERVPLLLVVDDAQWIDQATLDVLAFVARRAADEAVALAFGSREAIAADLGPGSQVIDVSPLTARESNQLLDLQPVPPQAGTRAAILEQAGGNPLALVELARAAAADPAAAGGWPAQPLPITERLQQSFTASVKTLPGPTQQALLLAAAADDIEMNLSLLSGPASIPAGAWDPARAAGLITVTDGSVTFTHPLIRSAVYQAAGAPSRAAAHRALAAALDHQPERQAWHLAAAAAGPDQALAQRLAVIARAAHVQGRLVAAAATWQRAAELSPDPRAAGEWVICASGALGSAGQVDQATSLARRGMELTDDPWLHGLARQSLGLALSLTFQHSRVVASMTELALELRDQGGAFPTWSSLAPAASAAYYSGEDSLYRQVLGTLQTLNGGLAPWQPAGLAAADVMSRAAAVWCGSAVLPLADRAAKLATIRELTGQVNPDLQIPLAAAALLADDPRQAALLRDQAEAAPSLLGNGATLMVITWAMLETGQWDAALEYAGRARTLADIYPEPVVRASATTAAAYIAACRGNTAAAAADAMSVLALPDLGARSSLTARANHAMGLAALVEGRYDEAFDHLRQLIAGDGRAAHNREAMFGLIDLAEAARRTGHGPEVSELSEGAFARTAGDLSPRLIQVRALCRALLADDTAAEDHFRQALDVAEGDHVPFERARTELSYGQWLHRARRDREARPHLNAAAHAFRQLAATPWLETATREQRAAGVRPAIAPADALSALSPAERQVALLAAEGLTNAEIAARLFVSPNTVGSHLYRSFTKLQVSNRSQLTALVHSSQR